MSWPCHTGSQLKSTDTETQCFSVCIWRKRCDCAAADPGFPGQGTSNQNVGTITYYFGQFFSKTEWKWKTIGPRGGANPGINREQPIPAGGGGAPNYYLAHAFADNCIKMKNIGLRDPPLPDLVIILCYSRGWMEFADVSRKAPNPWRCQMM